MVASSFSYGDITKTVQLPTTWQELYPFMNMHLYKSMLSLDADLIRVVLAEHFVDRYMPSAKNGRLQAIADVSKVFSFINFENNFSGFDWQYELTLHTKKYPMCKPMMHNSTLRELVIADGYLDKFVQGDADAIWPLTGTIFRPASDDQNHVLAQGDRREPLLSQDHANMLGIRFKSHAASLWHRDGLIKAAVHALLTVLATKHFFAKNYIPLLATDEQPDKNGINFGWHELAFDLSETGNFGTIDEVYNRNIHQIMLYCIKKKQDHDRFKEKIK